MKRTDLEKRLANMQVVDVLEDVIRDLDMNTPSDGAKIHAKVHITCMLKSYLYNFNGSGYHSKFIKIKYPKFMTFAEYKQRNKSDYTNAIERIHKAINQLGVKV